MTKAERANPKIIKHSRKKRIAAGSGTEVAADQQAAQDAPADGRHDERKWRKARWQMDHRRTGHQGRGEAAKLHRRPLDIASYGPLDTSNGQRLTIRSIKPHKNMLLARIEGVEDRNAAEALRGVELMIDRDRLPAADEDEIYHADLIGLSAHDTGGNLVGTVVDVLDFGAGELLELKPAQGKTFLVPFSVETVPEIDLDAGRLVIDPPEGLLD
jgi:16S rRNA processing protein RimM